jgi:hypothetical protein
MRAEKLIATTLMLVSMIAAPITAMAAKPAHTPVRPSAAAVVPLTEPEIATLTWMREEEKLARDIYIELNLFWPAKIFTNIAASEQRHFDALGSKLALYGIADPALPGIGSFSNLELQSLHDDLLAQGMVSYAASLAVGVVIEQGDIADLAAAIAGTNSLPLQTTYKHLLNGSENHLRSFEKLLSR